MRDHVAEVLEDHQAHYVGTCLEESESAPWLGGRIKFPATYCNSVSVSAKV